MNSFWCVCFLDFWSNAQKRQNYDWEDFFLNVTSPLEMCFFFIAKQEIPSNNLDYIIIYKFI